MDKIATLECIKPDCNGKLILAVKQFEMKNGNIFRFLLNCENCGSLYHIVLSEKKPIIVTPIGERGAQN